MCNGDKLCWVPPELTDEELEEIERHLAQLLKESE